MKKQDAFPSRWLSSADVDPPVKATIASIRMETIQGDEGERERPVMMFRGNKLKPLIMNATNWDICEAAFGEDSRDWEMRDIILYAADVAFKGKKTKGIRIRIPSQQARPVNKAPEPPAPDWADDAREPEELELGI